MNFKIKNNKPNPKAIIVAIPTDINIPYAPKPINKTGRANLKKLRIVFFRSTYFAERYAIKTFSERILREEKTANKINNIKKRIFSLTNNNFGENIFRKSK